MLQLSVSVTKCEVKVKVRLGEVSRGKPKLNLKLKWPGTRFLLNFRVLPRFHQLPSGSLCISPS